MGNPPYQNLDNNLDRDTGVKFGSLTQGKQSDSADSLNLCRHVENIFRVPELPKQHRTCSNGQERVRNVDVEVLIGRPK